MFKDLHIFILPVGAFAYSVRTLKGKEILKKNVRLRIESKGKVYGTLLYIFVMHVIVNHCY